jgi:hypothetical protein
MTFGNERDDLLIQSQNLISQINTLFNDEIIIQVDDPIECSKFALFMEYRPPGYEFKNNQKYVIICTDYLNNLIQLYSEEQARDFHLFILAHEAVHLLYGPDEVSNNISQYLKLEFKKDYGLIIDSSDLQHLNTDVLAMKILQKSNIQVKQYSQPFLEFHKVIGLYQTDEDLSQRLIYRHRFIKNSLNEKISEWGQYIWVDSLCERIGLHQGLTNLGIDYNQFCFLSPSPVIKENLKQSFTEYLIHLKQD